VLTFALGFLLTAARLIRDYGYTDGWRLFAAGSLNALFLPALVQPYQRADFFPFNGAAWSLTFELFANLIYWLLFRYLSARTLGIIIGGSAVALTIVGYMAGTIDIGMRPQDFLLGIPRVLFPFFVGVALRRYALERITFKAGEISVAAGVVVLLTTFSWSHLVSKNHLVIAELATLFVVFPGLLAALCKVIPGPRLATVCKLTGDASYPVYLLQTPFVMLFAAIPQVFFHTKAQAWVPYIGIAHISATLLCALWVDRYFELPVRNMLKTRWIAFQKRKQVGAAVPQPAEAP
jgi:peptidoglycan/LPS O-acetylase OafA/YrhL